MKRPVATKKKDSQESTPKSTTALRKSDLGQLRRLLKRYPDDDLDIDGIIVDFLGRSGESLDAVFDINHHIYTSLFTGEGLEKGRRLLESIGGSDSRFELGERCKTKYPVVTNIISQELSSEQGLAGPSKLIQDPSGTLGYTVHYIIWHLSDVHFGPFNKIKWNARELAFLIAKVADDYPALKPDVIIISGDLSSRAQPSEFQSFKIFCTELSKAMWGSVRPERILVVPGNHDVTWLPDGTADRMRQFSDMFSSDEVCVSPFGQSESVLDLGNVTISRSSPNPETVPPIAIVRDEVKSMKFILLVSGYFSGNVPPEVRSALDNTAGSDKDLYDLLRADEGEVTQEYLYHVGNALKGNASFCVGVIHHNPLQYGIETCQNSLAPQLMETLWSRKVPILLHGHVHLSEPRSNRRPAVPGMTYPVPAPTLTSITTAGSGRGINIHFIGPDSDQRRIDTLVWNYSPSMAFLPKDVLWRYRIMVGAETCSVDHLS